MLRIYLSFFLSIACVCSRNDEVATSNGVLRGKQLSTYGGKSGLAFLGIPFAKPPKGKLRFQRPFPPSNWTAIRESFEYKPACIADPTRTYKSSAGGPISEDCLYLNVFTSEKCLSEGGCAVMAVIHGGAYIFESPVVYRPEILINNFANEERNVIIVSLSFRLGLLGWFNIAPDLNTTADSNLGLRDCIFGLEWIQREISAFGGDTNRVTVMGHSSGGTMVNYLALSPMARGLFQQIISMSAPNTGVSLAKDFNRSNSQKIAQLIGCASWNETFMQRTRVEAIISCLRTKGTVQEILAAQRSLYDSVEETVGPWNDGPGGVLPGSLDELMSKRPQLKALMGTVTGEKRYSQSVADKNGNAIPSRLKVTCDHIGFDSNYEHPHAVAAACATFYGRVNKSQVIVDDFMFYDYCASQADSLSQTPKSRAFVYSYSYALAGPAWPHMPSTGDVSPTHAEDFIYIFGLHREKFTEKDYGIERIYSGILANFVNTGDPSYGGQNWENWQPAKRNYFHIDFDENLKMPGPKPNHYPEAIAFWRGIVKKLGGTQTPLKDLPRGFDEYNMAQVQIAISAKWNNESDDVVKSLKGELSIYDSWTKHLTHLQREHSRRFGKEGTSLSMKAAETSLVDSAVWESAQSETIWMVTGGVLTH